MSPRHFSPFLSPPQQQLWAFTSVLFPSVDNDNSNNNKSHNNKEIFVEQEKQKRRRWRSPTWWITSLRIYLLFWNATERRASVSLSHCASCSGDAVVRFTPVIYIECTLNSWVISSRKGKKRKCICGICPFFVQCFYRLRPDNNHTMVKHLRLFCFVVLILKKEWVVGFYCLSTSVPENKLSSGFLQEVPPPKWLTCHSTRSANASSVVIVQSLVSSAASRSMNAASWQAAAQKWHFLTNVEMFVSGRSSLTGTCALT